jgi:hypothetical protein
MSYWQFWRMLFGNAWERAFEASHRVEFHRFLVIQLLAIAAPIAKALGWLPIPHLEESTLIIIPILVFVGFLLWALTHEAYRAFRDEQTKSEDIKKKAAADLAHIQETASLELKERERGFAAERTQTQSQIEVLRNEIAEMRKPKLAVEAVDQAEDTGHKFWHCRIRVRNVGSVTVRKCGAMVVAIQPALHN